METLKKSPYIQLVKDGEMFVIWHSLFGCPQIINESGMELINFFSEPRSVDEVKKIGQFDNTEESVAVLKKNYILVPSDFNEREFLEIKVSSYYESFSDGRCIDYLSLIISEQCNFCCTYCISNSMIDASYRKTTKKKIMRWETAKRAIDIFTSILRSHNKRKAYINFGGGEPLLNWEVVNKSLSYCKRRYEKEFEFTFRINTNASLIDKPIAEILKVYDVKIALSMDGLKRANDRVRVSKSGKSAFSQIIAAIDALSRINFGVTGFSTTITEANFDLIGEDLIIFSQERGFVDLRIDLDVIHMLSVPVETAVEKLLNLKRFAESRGVHVTGFWERPVENLNSSILEKHIAFCGGVAGKSMCVSPSEEVFICGYSAGKFADLSKEAIISSNIYRSIVSNRLVGRVERCRGCIIEGQCIGGCHITEEFGDLTKKTALQYNCELYRQMTVELLKDSLKDATRSI